MQKKKKQIGLNILLGKEGTKKSKSITGAKEVTRPLSPLPVLS